MSNVTKSESVEAAARYLATYSGNRDALMLARLESKRASAKTEKSWTILSEMCDALEALAFQRSVNS